ncbi:MAG: tyrosine--tRNA ligase [Chlamydiae bacterium]|nr:tyrosine--tRNA ligase [Chlamydiota bacterium]
MENVIDILEQRGFIEALTSEEIRTFVKNPQPLYIGFDPTGDSLHLGHLIPILSMAWFAKYGHRPIALVGGATAMIGDPSGKSQERNLLDHEQIEKNKIGIRENLKSILRHDVPIIDNFDWFKKIYFIDFLRDIGKYFRIGQMLSKDSVKLRMESEEGMSFTEFSYQVLQGYDFLYLFQSEGVCLQMGGSDQWGNIVAGIELIRKVHGKPAFGITFPLLTRSDGKKNSAQKALAAAVTLIVHGEEGLRVALLLTEQLAPGGKTSLDKETLQALAQEGCYMDVENILGMKIVDLLVLTGLQTSKSDARRLIQNGGIYMNNEKMVDESALIKESDLREEEFVLLAIGKKQKRLIRKR